MLVNILYDSAKASLTDHSFRGGGGGGGGGGGTLSCPNKI